MLFDTSILEEQSEHLILKTVFVDFCLMFSVFFELITLQSCSTTCLLFYLAQMQYCSVGSYHSSPMQQLYVCGMQYNFL
jgi:hypothetical protein